MQLHQTDSVLCDFQRPYHRIFGDIGFIRLKRHLNVKEDTFHLMNVRLRNPHNVVIIGSRSLAPLCPACSEGQSISVPAVWRSKNWALPDRVLLELLVWHCQWIEMWCFPVYMNPIPGVKFIWGILGTISVITYVGVIRFIFMFSNSLFRFDLHNETCISKSMMKHHETWHWKSDLPWFSYGYRKCMFVDTLTKLHRSSQ